jgi:predicted NUDIX family NTP pyrophosphohydrolase
MKQSAGILVYRKKNGKIEVFLGHPGGPFWAKKDDAAWSIPKGEYAEGEDAFEAAKREYREEVGHPAPDGDYLPLGKINASGKHVTAWAVEKDIGDIEIKSNMVTIDWPPRSGNKMEIPEIDRAEWFEISAALIKVYAGQRELLHRLAEHLGISLQEADPSKSPDEKEKNQQISLL